MSSRSSNASSSSTTTNDNDVAADGNAIVASAEGGSVTINQTSAEAVDLGIAYAEAAEAMAERSIGLGERATLEALEVGKDALFEAFAQSNAATTRAAAQSSTALSTVNKALDMTLAEGRDDSTELSQQLIRMGIPAAVIIFALMRLA